MNKKRESHSNPQDTRKVEEQKVPTEANTKCSHSFQGRSGMWCGTFTEAVVKQNPVESQEQHLDIKSQLVPLKDAPWRA